MALRALHWAVLLFVLGCGETTTNASDATVSASVTNTTTGGTATEDFRLDTEPWFTGGSGQNAELPKVSTDAGRDEVIFIHLDEPGRFDISTHHHHFNFSAYPRVQFEARANADIELFLSITTLDAKDFWEDAAAGLVWQVATVRLGTEWAKYDVALSDLAPATTGTPEPLGNYNGSAIHFLIETTQSVEFWIDDIKLVSGAP